MHIIPLPSLLTKVLQKNTIIRLFNIKLNFKKITKKFNNNQVKTILRYLDKNIF